MSLPVLGAKNNGDLGLALQQIFSPHKRAIFAILGGPKKTFFSPIQKLKISHRANPRSPLFLALKNSVDMIFIALKEMKCMICTPAKIKKSSSFQV